MTSTRWPCESCNGTGRVYRHPTSSRTAECDECKGERWVLINDNDFLDPSERAEA